MLKNIATIARSEEKVKRVILYFLFIYSFHLRFNTTFLCAIYSFVNRSVASNPKKPRGLIIRQLTSLTMCLPREQKIQTICAVMGINQLKKVGDNWVPVQDVYDPDKTYELTSDNMKKILAIHMRFRYAQSKKNYKNGKVRKCVLFLGIMFKI